MAINYITYTNRTVSSHKSTKNALREHTKLPNYKKATTKSNEVPNRNVQQDRKTCYNTITKGVKVSKDVINYRLVALINILCKIFERMTHQRLVCYLEKQK